MNLEKLSEYRSSIITLAEKYHASIEYLVQLLKVKMKKIVI